MPYCIITYDVEQKRVNRVQKALRRYFTWVQNSVFEGEIQESKLAKCLQELQRIIKEDSDSIYVYQFTLQSQCQKKVLGHAKGVVLNIIR